MKRLALLLAALVVIPVFSAGISADAASKRKEKKEEVVEKKDTVVKKKVTKYDKTFVTDKNCVTARFEGGFMALHKVKGKLYLELPLTSLGREMLIASTITESSAADLASIGYKPTDPMHVKFQKVDSTVFMNAVTVLPDYDESNAPMAKAVAVTGMDPILDSWKITCWNNDSTAVVIDVNSLL